MKIRFFTISIMLFLSYYNCASQKNVKFNTNTGADSESFKSFTFNGAWSWFTDPRAVYYEGEHKKTYAGWIDNYGNITIGTYNHDTKQIKTHVLNGNVEIDDYNHPSILFDENGKLLVFFNRHNSETSSTTHSRYLIRAKNTEDISEWHAIQELHLNDETVKSISKTYSQPVRLKAENGSIYLFCQNLEGKPSFLKSEDNGVTWSKGKLVYLREQSYGFKQPYMKVYSNGDKKIHITFTDGSPKNENDNNIYYTYYENGAFYKADGSKIKNIEDLPIKAEELDVVYNAKSGEAKAWNWDIAEDKKGNPVIAYAKFPTDTTHYYCYAKWTGSKWLNKTLVNSGKWFQNTRKNKKESEPYYSGGMSIDHENTNLIYLSVNRDSIFEIEKWTTKNDGKSWKVDFITKGSSKNNVRPFAVRGAKEGNPLQVVWMQNSEYVEHSHSSEKKTPWSKRFQSSIKMNLDSPNITDPFDPEQIINLMTQTADWQFANPYDLDRILEWHWATYFVGLQAFYNITKEDRYRQEMINVGEHVNWKLLDNILYADQLAISSNWAWLYEMDKNPKMIMYSKWALDLHLAIRQPYRADVRFANNSYFVEWWTWCDSLFMGPPAFAQMYKATGEKKYLDYMDKMFWVTADYLYSPEDSLMFRDDRYFEKRSDTGKKIFWGRGNGWVMGGLVRILEIMPDDYPSRSKYVKMFKEIAIKLKELQGEDNLWRVSLLDPEYDNTGETSGSAFYVYALAWGLNNGVFDASFEIPVKKAWKALCSKVNNNGRLGGVQAEGIDPRKFTKEDWHVYGTGGFLLAGSEMYKLMMKK